MAILFENPRATFIHIPKTAGTSFMHWTRQNLQSFQINYKHGDIDKLKLHWNDLGFKFTFVRNPFDRLVSLFHYAGQNINHTRWQEIYVNGFEWWLHQLYETHHQDQRQVKNIRIWKSTIKNQVDWFKKDQIDCIIKTEELHKDFVLLQKKFNCYKNLPIKNKSKHKNYKEYYSKTTKKYVYDMFKKDFEILNYDF